MGLKEVCGTTIQSTQGSRNSGTSSPSHGRRSAGRLVRSPSAPVFSGGSSRNRGPSTSPFSNWHSRMACGRSGSPLGKTWAAGSSSSETTINSLANLRRPWSSSRSIPSTRRSLPCKRGRLTLSWHRVKPSCDHPLALPSSLIIRSFFPHPFLPRFRNRIWWTWLSFCSTCPQSCSPDTVRPSPLGGPTRACGWRTVQRWTSRRVLNSRSGWCRSGHAFPRRGREPVLGGAKAEHRRCQVLRAVLRVRPTSRYDRVARWGRWSRAVHPRFGGGRKRRRHYSNQARNCGGYEERRPQLSHFLGGHGGWRIEQASARKGKRCLLSPKP